MELIEDVAFFGSQDPNPCVADTSLAKTERKGTIQDAVEHNSNKVVNFAKDSAIYSE